MVIFVICKNKEDPLNLKALEWSQHFDHCKAIEIFSDAEVQLTLQSEVESGGNYR